MQFVIDYLKAVLVMRQDQPEVNDVTVFRSRTELEDLNLIGMSKNDDTSNECITETKHRHRGPSDIVATAKGSSQPVMNDVHIKRIKSELKEGTLEMIEHYETSENCAGQIPCDPGYKRSGPSDYAKAVMAKDYRQPEMNVVSIHRRKPYLRITGTGATRSHTEEKN